ncbi:MAG: alpha/beta hydrolase [Chloroflexota bacterium]
MPVAGDIYYFHHKGGSASKPPLILIHGAGGNHLFWPPEIRRLAGYRVFALDLPGHGGSEGAGRQSIEDYARSVINFMDAVSLSKAVITGHSMGGAIGLSMALNQPDRVAGIGLVASGARLRVAPGLIENTANPDSFQSAIELITNAAFGPHAESKVKAIAAERMSKTRSTVLHSDLIACDHFDVLDRVHEISLPALIVCGTEDKLTPIHFAETLASRMPCAALQTIDGAGHMVMLEQPRRVAGIMTVFMATVPYTPGS